ncbi:hypothetical protein ACWEO2_19250 [Nocardia sp. NPDC004278]
MKSHMRSALFGIAAVGCTALATVGSAPAAFAVPAPGAVELCRFTFLTPDDAQRTASTVVSAEPGNSGILNLYVHTDAQSDTEYEQRFSFTWSNLDTGRSGNAETTTRVQGPDNEYLLRNTLTESGRLALVLRSSNRGLGELSNHSTNGDCSAEYTA